MKICTLPLKKQRFAVILALVVFLLTNANNSFLLGADTAPAKAERWTAEKAWNWYNQQPWLVGCNFLPSTAVNDVEMWQKETFDPKTIDRELGWAQNLGFNTVRIFLNEVVWESDAEGLKERMRQFLEIADKHHITSLVILFDDCFKPNPQLGKQPEPVPGMHNSQWVQSPGAARRDDRAAWPKLEQYVKDTVGTFGNDKRVLAWDVYNEPGESLPLVEAAFQWTREAKPTQPITTTVNGNPKMSARMQERVKELSDIISFHDYAPLPNTKGYAAGLLPLQRPILCTEWMCRPHNSLFKTHLPYFKEQKIGCWNWGLVNGRTQTHFPWGETPSKSEPELWFHDLLRRDGTPYLEDEAAMIRSITGVSKTPSSGQ